MALVQVIRILDRDLAIDGLIRVRQEWQEAAAGNPLAMVQGSVGLLLADVVAAIGLLPEEVDKVLGEESFTEAMPWNRIGVVNN